MATKEKPTAVEELETQLAESKADIPDLAGVAAAEPKTIQALAAAYQDVIPKPAAAARPDILTQVVPAALAGLAKSGYSTPFSAKTSQLGQGALGFMQGFNLMRPQAAKQNYTIEDLKMASEIVKNLREAQPKAVRPPTLPNPFYMAIGLNSLKMQNPALYQQLSKFYGGIAGATGADAKAIEAYSKAQATGNPALYLAIDEMINSPDFTISKATAQKLKDAGVANEFMLIRKDFLGQGLGETPPAE